MNIRWGYLLIVLVVFALLQGHVMADQPDRAKVDLFVQYEDGHEIVQVEERELEARLLELELDPQVVHAGESIQLFVSPNDPLYSSKQVKDFNPLQAEQAWSIFNPQDEVVVAIIDTGIELNHSDLQGLIVQPTSVLAAPNNTADDTNGHGTHVAGIISALTNNNMGVASLSQGNLKIMPIRVTADGNGTTQLMGNGIRTAVDQGADIISISMGAYSDGGSHLKNAIEYAFNHDVLVIAASGNDNSDTSAYPARYPQAISVSASEYSPSKNIYGNKASFSNYGNGVLDGTQVELAAPGVGVMSTFIADTALHVNGCEQNSGDYYCSQNGTSMATPFVASLAGMLKLQEPSLVDLQMRYIMHQTSENNGNPQHFGFGKIRAYDALDYVRTAHRLFGNSAIETSMEIASKGWGNTLSEAELKANDPSADVHAQDIEGKFVFLATNASFPDSLSGTVLARNLDAPLLLTNSQSLSNQTLLQLQQWDADFVVLLGGDQAISPTIEIKLQQEGFGTVRLAGKTRYDTAINISEYVATTGGEVILASGDDFPDALAVAQYAADLQIPIALVRKNEIPQATKQFLDKYQFSKQYVIGGDGAISNDVYHQLSNPHRIFGKNRYETAIEVHKYFGEHTDQLYFASGETFRDALPGANLAAKTGAQLLFVQPNQIPEATQQYLGEHIDAMDNSGQTSDFDILGGPVAVHQSTAWHIDRFVRYEGYYETDLVFAQQAQAQQDHSANGIGQRSKVDLLNKR